MEILFILLVVSLCSSERTITIPKMEMDVKPWSRKTIKLLSKICLYFLLPITLFLFIYFLDTIILNYLFLMVCPVVFITMVLSMTEINRNVVRFKYFLRKM